jgi:hypothetical protein
MPGIGCEPQSPYPRRNGTPIKKQKDAAIASKYNRGPESFSLVTELWAWFSFCGQTGWPKGAQANNHI